MNTPNDNKKPIIETINKRGNITANLKDVKKKNNDKKQKKHDLSTPLVPIIISSIVVILVIAGLFYYFLSVGKKENNFVNNSKIVNTEVSSLVKLILEDKWNEKIVDISFDLGESDTYNLDMKSTQSQTFDLLEILDNVLMDMKLTNVEYRKSQVENLIIPLFHNKKTLIKVVDKHLQENQNKDVTTYFNDLAQNISDYQYVKPIACKVKAVESERGKVSLYFDSITMIEIQ